MMEESIGSISSASISKGFSDEETVSNERIRKGDEILETYVVTSDAVHGGMGSV